MITTSLDGHWATLRRGRDVLLLERGAAPAVGRIELADDDVDLAFVGPPAALVTVIRGSEPRVVLHHPPHLEAVARLDLERPMRLAAVTGSRVALLGTDGASVAIVRVAGRGLSSHPIEVSSPVEFAVGLERNQLLFSIAKKLEVWDALSARPLLRLQLQLPPPPRQVGSAQGHLWCTRPGSDEVYVYRLSDGRPFRHYAGATVQGVVSHPSSPVIVLITPAGLVRLHCFAHSLTAIESPWTPGMMLGQLVAGEELELIGVGDGEPEPWRVSLGGSSSVQPLAPDAGAEPGAVADAVPEQRDHRKAGGRAAAPELAAPIPMSQVSSLGIPSVATAPGPGAPGWREALAAFGLEVSRGHEVEVPTVPVDSTIGALAHRLTLPSPARRALLALYGLYLNGETTTIARLAAALGDWQEPLGQGALGALALLKRREGRVQLRRTVTELLDGAAPRAIRLVGAERSTLRPGAVRLARAQQPTAAHEAALASRFGRIAILEGKPSTALLEARLNAATAVTFDPPPVRPSPWPRDTSLVVVADDDALPAWVRALPPDVP